MPMISQHSAMLLHAAVFLLAIGSQPLLAEPSLRRVSSDPEQGLSAAVVVDGASLMHTAQLLPPQSAQPDGQFDALMGNLDKLLRSRDAQRDDVVKLNFCVSGAAVADDIRSRLAGWFGEQALPAVSYVQSRLPQEGAQMAADAVVAVEPLEGQRPQVATVAGLDAHTAGAAFSVMPRGGAVYISGQAQPGDLAAATRATLQELLRTLQHLDLDRQHIVQVKCFLAPMAERRLVDEQIAEFFGDLPTPPVAHVEWIAGSLPIEIELVACDSRQRAGQALQFITPPWMKASPVFCRVTRLRGDQRVYVSGLYSEQDGDGESQVRDIFKSLQSTLALCGSDISHLAKATYYVSTDDASGKLNAVRPEIYDPARPPAASKAVVAGVAKAGRSITIDMIALPSSR